jgi:hypothetical protein
MADEATITVELDRYQRGAVLTALSDERNLLIEEGRSTDTVNEVIVKVAHAEPRKRRGRDEAR